MLGPTIKVVREWKLRPTQGSHNSDVVAHRTRVRSSSNGDVGSNPPQNMDDVTLYRLGLAHTGVAPYDRPATRLRTLP
jgi:hypothetical protein